MWSLTIKLINLKASPYSNVSSGILHSENSPPYNEKLVCYCQYNCDEFCASTTNYNAKVPNSTAKSMNLIAKPTSSIANGLNSIAKAMNSTASGAKSIAKTCKSHIMYAIF